MITVIVTVVITVMAAVVMCQSRDASHDDYSEGGQEWDDSIHGASLL